MTLWKKLLIVFGGLTGFLLIVLLVLAKTMITPERVRESLVPLAARSLQRDLQLGDIEISLFSGIVINNLVLNERGIDDHFITVEKAVLRYRLWPLFLMRVEVDELRLEQPGLHLRRLNDESFNYSDLTKTSEVERQAPPGETTSPETKMVAVHISKIVISDGTITYTNQSDKTATTQTVSAVNLAVKNFSMTEPFPLKLSANWNGNKIAIDGDADLDDLSADVVARINALKVGVEGHLLSEAKGNRLRAEIDVPAVSISELLASVPKELTDIPDSSGLSGQLSATLVIDGMVSDPETLLKTGRIDLRNITAVSKFTRTLINGTLLLKQQSLTTDNLKMAINDQPIDVMIKVDNVARQPVKAGFSITSARVDLDRFIPAVAEEAPDKATDTSQTDPVSQPGELGPYNLPIDLNGTVDVEQLLYHGLAMQEFRSSLSFRNNVLTIESLAAKVAGGKFEQTGKVNLGVRGIRYSNESEIYNVNINPVVAALKPEFAKNIYGVVDGRMTMRGAGTELSSIKQNLKGAGAFTLKQAKLASIPALDSAAVLLGMPDLKELEIDQGQADFQIDKELVTFELVSKGPQLKQNTNGTVTLAGQLGLNSKLFLSPELSRKLDNKGLLRNVLVGRDGWSQIPLRVKGDYSAPKVSLDMKVLKKQAAQGALDSLANRLLKKDKGNSGGSEPNNEEDPAAKLIDSAIKGLFGN